MTSRIGFFLRRLRERLWVKPLAYCLAAVACVFAAQSADYLGLGDLAPKITPETIEKLLSIISASMLAVATFAVASMISAYASASASATPRAFTLVVADDVSQTALSSFVGAFIFSIVAIIALKTGYYGRSGLFVLFVVTLMIFAWVIATFVRWVDSIARLGRLGATIEKAEKATFDALVRRRGAPRLGGAPVPDEAEAGAEIFSDAIGYVQHVDMEALDKAATEAEVHVTLACLPGAFTAPGRPLLFVENESGDVSEETRAALLEAVLIGDDRTFDEDPRFGLIVLAEIAARALSPAVNDPGTAISIIGTFVRLFACWANRSEDEAPEARFERVRVPELKLSEMFDDAFTAIERDGASAVEVGIRLQKAFLALTELKDDEITEAARRHSDLALARAEAAMSFGADIEKVRAVAEAIRPPG